MGRRLALVASLAAAAVLVAACSGAASVPAASQRPVASAGVQTSEGGQVTVAVSWAGPASGAVFDVKLDTHSVDLDALDLANAVLSNDRGETLGARPWAAPKGGHHREGTLTFDGDGPGFFASVRWIELALTGVGDLPVRTLRWEIGP